MEILAKDFEMKKKDEENTWKNEAKKGKRRKVLMKTAPDGKGMKKFKCDICEAIFGRKAHCATGIF